MGLQIIHSANEEAIKYSSFPLYLRGDCGFASPELYKAYEDNDCKYAIRLKDNQALHRLAADADDALYRATRNNQFDYAVKYGEFMYQAGSWPQPRRVVFKVEKPYGQLVHIFAFIITTMESEPYQVIQFYCGRGKMEALSKKEKAALIFLLSAAILKSLMQTMPMVIKLMQFAVVLAGVCEKYLLSLHYPVSMHDMRIHNP